MNKEKLLMPHLSFVMPHWMYWGSLVLFPLITFLIYHRNKNREHKGGLSLPLGYFLLLVGGFLGIHRLYVKSAWALAFVSLFVGILVVNVQVREARDGVSSANNKVRLAEFKIQRATKDLKKGRRNAQKKLEAARTRLVDANRMKKEAAAKHEQAQRLSMALGAAVLLLLLIDAILLPRLIRRQREREAGEEVTEGFVCPLVEEEHDDSKEPFAFNRAISKVNGVVGEWVAYWSVLAVFVFYYEVLARYVFNSPTNWAHESMFLMFGMQYLLAGGFVLREGAHVRVDVIYMYLSRRGRAFIDLLTSVFFFIFTLALIWTGWTFFRDSFDVNEVSFTEWGIQYWPVKFALPLGGVLLLLQGIALLFKNFAVFIDPTIDDVDAKVRPEG